MAICEQCGKEHDGTFGSGRFCSRSCSNKWVALHQSDEAKARKVASGKKNLTRAGKGWNITKDQNSEYGKLGAQARAVTMKSRRKDWIEGVLAGSIDPWLGSYSRFRERLIEFGYKEHVCESCQNSEWLGVKIPLEIHHVNGDHTKNNLENIQLLCPNCHSLTDNYKWKKHNAARRRSPQVSEFDMRNEY